jgi:hypothetical protein
VIEIFIDWPTMLVVNSSRKNITFIGSVWEQGTDI